MKYPATKTKSTITDRDLLRIERDLDAFFHGTDDDEPVTTEEAVALMLADFDNMSPKQQSTYRDDVRKASMAMDALVEQESERRDAKAAEAGEQIYRDRKRLMNDIWTETNDGVSRTFVGSLHPERITRY
jgi:hypothetical protein